MHGTEIRALLFDLDGTIIDTEHTAMKVVQKVYAEWKIPTDSIDALQVTGKTWDSAFDFLFEKYPPPISDRDARNLMLKRYREEIEKNLETVPGSVEAVKSLSQSYTLALVSGSRRADILWALGKLGILSCFKEIFGAEDYLRSKPAPDGYLKALAELSLAPEACLVFEDSIAGISSAKQAGLRVVAVTSTNHFSHDLSNADHAIADFRGVTSKWIRNLSFD